MGYKVERKKEKYMVITATTAPSLETFLELPETKPASEFINGQISQKVMPQGETIHLKTHTGCYTNI
jgi:Uma2 family endonuclease